MGELVKHGSVVEGQVEESSMVPSRKSALAEMQEMIALAPVMAKQYEELRDISLSVVVKNPRYWYLWGSEKQGWKARINDAGAAKLLGFSRIKMVGGGETTKEMLTLSDGTQKYIVWHKATFQSPFGGEIAAIGSCTSDDPFVASRWDYNPETKRREKVQIPWQDVDYTNVVKAALANCVVNGVSAILGIKGMDPEELRALGIDVDKIERVGMVSREWQISEKQRTALSGMGATEAQMDACRSQADVDKLYVQLRSAHAVKTGTTSGKGDQKVPQLTMNQLAKAAKDAGIPWAEVDEWRRVCFGAEPGDPWMMSQASHAAKWLSNPMPPDEYMDKMITEKEK